VEGPQHTCCRSDWLTDHFKTVANGLLLLLRALVCTREGHRYPTVQGQVHTFVCCLRVVRCIRSCRLPPGYGNSESTRNGGADADFAHFVLHLAFAVIAWNAAHREPSIATGRKGRYERTGLK